MDIHSHDSYENVHGKEPEMSESMELVVETDSGKIEGYQNRGLYVFKGIPYAAPPIGDQRWLPPKAVEPWSGVRQSQSYAAIAPQVVSPQGVFNQRPTEEPQSEDCLYLNVWTPGLDNARRPVLFWIHGGGFTGGSGSQPGYKGSRLSARGNVVVVTINYRLGSLGFLNLNEVTGGRIPATGNEGLLDQITAMQWVRSNIMAFGGNPDNVTLFGESAGGMSIGCLLASPQAKGLFHKAILQSGAASTISPLAGAKQVAEQFFEILDLGPTDIDDPRSLPVERLLAAQQELAPRMLASGRRMGMPLQPVIDGAILHALPLDAIKNGSASEIPIIVGTNLDEWKSLGMNDQELPKLGETGLLQRCKRLMPEEKVEALVETYREARARRGVSTTPAELFSAIQTDQMFRIPAVRLAEAQQRQEQSAYNYIFTWSSPTLDGSLSAYHGLEVGFVFGNYTEEFSGSGSSAEVLSGNMQDAWLAFAHNGDPSCKSLGNWPPYDNHRVTMLLGEECHAEEAPYDDERRAWDSV